MGSSTAATLGRKARLNCMTGKCNNLVKHDCVLQWTKERQLRQSKTRKQKRCSAFTPFTPHAFWGWQQVRGRAGIAVPTNQGAKGTRRTHKSEAREVKKTKKHRHWDQQFCGATTKLNVSRNRKQQDNKELWDSLQLQVKVMSKVGNPRVLIKWHCWHSNPWELQMQISEFRYVVSRKCSKLKRSKL